MNRCTQLVLHPLGNVEPVQLVVEQTGESAIVLPRVGDDANSGIHNSLELVHVVDLDAPARMALQ